ncbi:hypothetical protein NMY22_g15572 [Coprinellus aureogranulatus]|nr:hypothetical protein NMY22_g15572 [Coprinellus aureogranulatus]
MHLRLHKPGSIVSTFSGVAIVMSNWQRNASHQRSTRKLVRNKKFETEKRQTRAVGLLDLLYTPRNESRTPRRGPTGWPVFMRRVAVDIARDGLRSECRLSQAAEPRTILTYTSALGSIGHSVGVSIGRGKKGRGHVPDATAASTRILSHRIDPTFPRTQGAPDVLVLDKVGRVVVYVDASCNFPVLPQSWRSCVEDEPGECPLLPG